MNRVIKLAAVATLRGSWLGVIGLGAYVAFAYTK